MEFAIQELSSPAQAPFEVVERKGLGHPDSLCDALAEELSRSLSRCYLERFGAILHHNVDKALLVGGASRPAYGGGEVLEPMELTLAGRAVSELRGARIPIEELVVEGSRRWLREHLHALDPVRHLRFRSCVRPGSAELVELFARGGDAPRRANDTSIGVGYAPRSALERTVLELERWLSSQGAAGQPALGEDVKVMGVRRGSRIELTVACAIVDRTLRHQDDYLALVERVARELRERAREISGLDVELALNAADAPEQGSVYLTVTGTSAEAGDDGQAGRGNRYQGLITPGRPMTLESVAGKNPVNHVGKLYNALAQRIAQALLAELPLVAEAQCLLVSRIGVRIDEPALVLLSLRRADAGPSEELRAQASEIARQQLGRAGSLWRDFVSGALGAELATPF